jgi:lysophospholipase L1-like esterase
MKRVISDIEVDGAVSRQAANTVALLKVRQQSGRLGDVVVIHIGSNGYITAKQFDQMMAVLKDVRRVVFVNVKVPRRWETPNNVVIAEGVKKYPNTVLVDWRAASAGHPEYFGKDGIHLQGAGARRFTQIVAASLGR